MAKYTFFGNIETELTHTKCVEKCKNTTQVSLVDMCCDRQSLNVIVVFFSHKPTHSSASNIKVICKQFSHLGVNISYKKLVKTLKSEILFTKLLHIFLSICFFFSSKNLFLNFSIDTFLPHSVAIFIEKPTNSNKNTAKRSDDAISE